MSEGRRSPGVLGQASSDPPRGECSRDFLCLTQKITDYLICLSFIFDSFKTNFHPLELCVATAIHKFKWMKITHMKAVLLTQYPSSRDKKNVFLLKIDISQIEIFHELNIMSEAIFSFLLALHLV